ncbi:hypothetical protein KH5_15360 [Urechidicola sp. KH5]
MIRAIYLFIFLSFSILCYSQNWRAFNDLGPDNNWSTISNWDTANGGPSLPLSNTDLNIDIWNNVSSIFVDVDFNMKTFSNNPTRIASDGSIAINGSQTLTIDNQSNSYPAGDNALGLFNESSEGTTLQINCNIIIENSFTPNQFVGWTTIRNINGASNSIVFGNSSTLTLSGNGNTSTWSDNEAQSVIFEGVLLSPNSGVSRDLQFGKNSKNNIFNATADNSMFKGNFRFLDNSEVIVNTSNFANAATGNTKLFANGNGLIVLNIENCLQNGVDINVNKKKTFTLDINESQNELGQILFTGNSPEGVIVLNISDLDDFNTIVFEDNSSTDWLQGSINIVGFREGLIKFGNDVNGLTQDQLDVIEIIDGPYMGMDVALDSFGQLHLASTLSEQNVNTFRFSIYPNPADNQIFIQSEELLKQAQILDLLGKTVFTTNKTANIDLSNLTSGMYVLQLEAESGGLATKKIVKK